MKALWVRIFSFALLAGLAAVPPPAGAFTYQGRLELNGSSVSGNCDLDFKLVDAVTNGQQLGPTLEKRSVAVADGLFMVELNASMLYFDGLPRWLRIFVRCPAGSGAFTELTPRQELTPVPYAIYADKSGTAPWSGLSDIPTGLADGVDDDTTYSAGTGLSLGGTTFSVDTSVIQKRVDDSCPPDGAVSAINADGSVLCVPTSIAHDHWGESWSGSGGGLALSSSDSVGLVATSVTNYGVWGASNDATASGVIGENTAGGPGVIGTSSNGFGGVFGGVSGRVASGLGDIKLLGRGEIFTEESLAIYSNGGINLYLDNDGNSANDSLDIYSSTGPLAMRIDENGDLWVTGDFLANGTKSAVVDTPDHGRRKLYAVESPGVWFEDFGTATLANGEARVEFEAVFSRTVNTSTEYHVFVTPVCAQPILVSVAAKDRTGFTVRGVTLSGAPSGCSFDYRVVARRVGYEAVRLEQAD